MDKNLYTVVITTETGDDVMTETSFNNAAGDVDALRAAARMEAPVGSTLTVKAHVQPHGLV
jgi:hypothetical protein